MIRQDLGRQNKSVFIENKPKEIKYLYKKTIIKLHHHQKFYQITEYCHPNSDGTQFTCKWSRV